MAARRTRKTTSAEASGGGPELSPRQVALAAAVQDLRTKYPHRIFSGTEYTMPWAVRRLPFGIVDLDIATNGGAPAGGMTMLVGRPSEGKNYLLNRLIANQQRLYGADCAVAVIGTELSYDKGQGRKVGVKVALSEDEIAAEDAKLRATTGVGLTAAEAAELRSEIGLFQVVPPRTAEEAFDIAVDMVRTGMFNIVALDSFGSVLPEGDEDKQLSDGNQRVAGPAGLNTQLMRKLNSAFAPLGDGSPNLTCFVGINQVRDKMNAKPNEPQTTESGGWSLKHGRFLTIQLTRTAYLSDKETKRKFGKTIMWEVTKQKAGGYEGHRGQYDYIMAETSIDEGELLLRVGAQYGVIDKVANTYSYSGLTLGVGAGKAADKLVELALLEEIYDEVLRRAHVSLVT